MPPLPVDTPSAEPAHLVALADRCVQCGLCLPHCPTYRLDRLEAEGPRGRIAYAKAVAEGSLEPTEAGDRHLDHCLGCRRCEQACPAGVRYEDLLFAARANQFERRRPDPMESAVLWTLPRPAARAIATTLGRLTGRLPPRPALATLPVAPETAALETAVPAAEVVSVFVGCLASDYEAGTRAGLARLLAAVGVHASVPADQTCCGTAAAHRGDTGAARSLADRNRAAFAADRTVLSLASGCQSVLAASLGGAPQVVDALAYLASRADRLRFRPATGPVAVHVPCSQRVLGGDGPLRQLLALVPGADPVELPDTGCCGAAGLHMLSEPERAAALRAPLLEALAATGATQLLSANIGCRLHLAKAAGIPVRHPLDFLAEHLA